MAWDIIKSTEPRLSYLGEQERAFEIYRSRAAFRAASLLASDGVPLTILVAGDPRRPTVLLVNALGVSCLFVANLAMRLAEEYHVVSWESRGLPDERLLPADADVSIARHAADAVEVLGRQTSDLHAVVSYCSGANVAAYALAKQLIAARALCIISPSIELATASARTEYQRTVLPMWRAVAQSGLRHAALIRILLQEGQKAPAGTTDYELAALNALPFRTDESTYLYARLQAACLETDWDQLLRQLKLPTLVLHGARDDLIHIATPEAVARAVTGATFRTVDAGHFAVHTSRALHAEIASFLRGINSSAPGMQATGA